MAISSSQSNSYRVATLSISLETVANLASKTEKERYIFGQVRSALAAGPDLLVLPEACWEYGVADLRKQTESRESPRVRMMGSLARKHQCYIAMPIIEKRGRDIFNTLLLLDRLGRIVWHFDKVFLTGMELDFKIKNGTQLKAYDADFGRLGAAICFDLNFPELAYAWKEQDVDVVLFSSMYRGGAMVSRWALMTNAYIVTSTGDEGSTIMDPLGRSLGATSQYNPFLVRDIPRDYDVFHIAYNEASWPGLRAQYGRRLHLEIESQLAHFVLESRDPALRVSDLVREYKLLTLGEALPKWRAANAANADLFRKSADRM